ncbi:MAG: hypothetical protein IPJ65_15475, partial [Archangiaceae bacterium]|nr:hypothetical protein [Archangiaceae bacterium]
MRTDALRFSLWVALAVSIASPACNCLNPITDVKYPACGSDADCELREGYHCCELASAGTGKHCVPGTCDAPPDGGAGGAADAGVCNATSCA